MLARVFAAPANLAHLKRLARFQGFANVSAPTGHEAVAASHHGLYDAVVAAAPIRTTLYESARIVLRRLAAGDRNEFVGLVNLSADFLHPWVYLPATPDDFDKYLRRFDGQNSECTVACIRDSGAIAGTVSINDIIRGPYRRATVGYNAFSPTARRGYMSEAFSLVFRFSFNDLGLHRLEADIQPGNEASLRFAQRVGFRREGYSPGYIYIDGSWRDHERWATNSDLITLR